MPHFEKQLKAAFVRSAPPGRHTDGGGLYLYVSDSGARRWVLRITVRGKRRNFGLGSSPFIGNQHEKAVYLLFSPAEQGFAREASGNVLTPDVLANLPLPSFGSEGVRVVYAEGCTVSAERLKAEGVIFKQIPYQIEGN